MNVYVITALILVFYIVLAWLSGALLRLHGTTLWVLRGGLIFIGIVAAGLFLWFHHRLKKRKSTTPSEVTALSEQIKILLRQAEQKLVSGNQGRLQSLPIVFVLGDLNSAKTSSILYSGLEPELIAGHVFRDKDIVPTATINVWFARKTVFIEAGGKLAASSQLWSQVLRQTRPQRISAALGKGQQAPRAALVCMNCERLAVSQSVTQDLSNRLKEMARSLGAPFPVYVLFTKLDRMPHFAEFVGNFASEESAQILGSTLSRVNTHGVFAEEESRRLARAFDQIIYSLAEKRLDYLGRETVAEKLPGIYEFPRELRKSRNQIVQLLVDLTRPTQLNANPFLRGFYFSGVRAVVVNEAVPVPNMARTAAVSGSGATRMFVIGEDIKGPAHDVPRTAVESRKVPEWTFLPHLFTEVVLADRMAFAASYQSTRVDRLRQTLLAFAVAIFLFFISALIVSFVKNRGLENDVSEHAEVLKAISAPDVTQQPTLEQLKQLEELRAELATLIEYQASGPPLSYRFGLYSGDRIYPDAYRLYFQNFRRLLLAPAQSSITAILRQPPAQQGSTGFQQIYLPLKAYLITTRNHEHADWDSLVTVLLGYSPAFNRAAPETQNLIRQQFAFYAKNLLMANPFSQGDDGAAIDKARDYLQKLGELQAIYQAMLDDAGRGKPAINFNRQFPQSSPYVLDRYEVPAAFTRDGFIVMQNSLRNPEKFQGEAWVLGEWARRSESAQSLRDALAQQYANDYMNHWRLFLRSAHVVGFDGIKDAAFKLTRLVGNDSPLLQLLWLAKEHTDVDLPDMQNPFQSVQSTAKDSTQARLVGPGNQNYMNALTQLQSSAKQAADTPNGPIDLNLLGQVQQAASAARRTVTGINQSFTRDTQGDADKQGGVDKNVSRLLEEPIDSAERAAEAGMSGGARAVCTLVNEVTAKRPFNVKGSEQATLRDVQDLFRPQDGNLWRSVQEKLGSAVARQGSAWVNIGQMPQSPSFLAFLNRAQQFTDALFPNGTPNMRLSYELRRIPTGGITANLVIAGQTLDDTGRPQQLTWQGMENTVSLSITVAGQRTEPVLFQGPWALFDFFAGAEWTGNNPATLSYPLKSTVELAHHPVSGSAKASVEYQLATQGVQVFSREFLKGLHCSAH